MNNSKNTIYPFKVILRIVVRLKSFNSTVFGLQNLMRSFLGSHDFISSYRFSSITIEFEVAYFDILLQRLTGTP